MSIKINYFFLINKLKKIKNKIKYDFFKIITIFNFYSFVIYKVIRMGKSLNKFFSRLLTE